jgi:adenosylcobinamide-GDP ribazoletransferase
MLLDAWRLAVGTLTAVPVKPPTVADRQRAGAAMMLAPLAALPLGAAATLVALAGAALDLPVPVVALLVLGAAILGNRAFHLDGLSDTVDGMAASYDRERSLAVMKTGTSGPAGVVAVVLVLGLQAVGLASVLSLPDTVGAAVLAGCAVCVARVALATCCGRKVPSARPGGLGHTYTDTVRWSVVGLLWLAGGAVLGAAGAWAGLDWWRGPLAVAIAVAVVAVLVLRAIRRLGGVTGDVLGAGVELALAAVLVGLA